MFMPPDLSAANIAVRRHALGCCWTYVALLLALAVALQVPQDWHDNCSK